MEKALFKYRMFEKHFSIQHESIQKFVTHFENRKKNRLVVKRGVEYISLRPDDIILFYTENKLVYVIDNNGKNILLKKTWATLKNF